MPYLDLLHKNINTGQLIKITTYKNVRKFVRIINSNCLLASVIVL